MVYDGVTCVSDGGNSVGACVTVCAYVVRVCDSVTIPPQAYSSKVVHDALNLESYFLYAAAVSRLARQTGAAGQGRESCDAPTILQCERNIWQL